MQTSHNRLKGHGHQRQLAPHPQPQARLDLIPRVGGTRSSFTWHAARVRADTLAEAAGVTIAGVVDIVEGGPPPSFPRAKAERMTLAADASTVTVTYRLA